MSQAAVKQGPHLRTSPKRVAFSAFLGGMLEYYDFYIYATAAALVLGRIFFPQDGELATLAALGTFGVAYVARPFGAILFGHFGDRISRRWVFTSVVLLMGTVTFLIGCLPDYETIGIAAPILLVVLRLLQGLSAGAETATASSMTIEVAPPRHRALYMSWTPTGIIGGFVLASAVFIPISALPEDALLSWGWRIPFWLSAVVAVLAYVFRRTLAEPEAFVQAKVDGDLARVPVVRLLRERGLDVLRVVACALFGVTSTMVAVYGLSYATSTAGIDRTTMLWIAIGTNVAAMVAQPLFAILADRIGRKPVFIAGAVACGLLIFPYLAAVSSGNVVLVALAAFCLISIGYSALNGTYTPFFSEMFPLSVRTSGMGIGQQLGLLVGGFAPAIALGITAGDPENWVPAAVFTAVVSLTAAAAALTARETAFLSLQQLGVRGERSTRRNPESGR